MSALPDRTFRKLLVAEIAVACIGCALLAAALASNQEWFDRHFLPAFFVTRAKYVRVEWYARAATAVVGAVIAFLARRSIARAIAQNPARTLHVALAICAFFIVARYNHDCV